MEDKKLTAAEEIEQTRRMTEACFRAGFEACRAAVQSKKVTNSTTAWQESEIRQALEEVFATYRDDVAEIEGPETNDAPDE